MILPDPEFFNFLTFDYVQIINLLKFNGLESPRNKNEIEIIVTTQV